MCLRTRNKPITPATPHEHYPNIGPYRVHAMRRETTNKQRASYQLRRLKNIRKNLNDMAAPWEDIDNYLQVRFEDVENEVVKLIDELQQVLDEGKTTQEDN